MNIVFLSGFLFPQTFLGQAYFRGLKQHLPDTIKSLFPSVPPTASIAERAGHMVTAMTRALSNGTLNDRDPVHLVAHSMGGLDARYLLSTNPSLRDSIRSLTTIGTPHKGSPIADLIIGPQQYKILDVRGLIMDAAETIFRRLGISISGLRELTTQAAGSFNETHRKVGSVECFSIAGIGYSTGRPTSLILDPSYRWITHKGQTDTERSNDGLVSRDSAEWGNRLDPWKADHFSEIGYDLKLPGQARRFNYLAHMDDIIRRLRFL